MGKGRASKVEQYSSALQAQSAQRLASLATQQYKWWKDFYAPQEKALVAQYSKPVQTQSYFKKAMGDVSKQYGDIGSNIRRTYGGKYQYGGGYGPEASKNLALSKASARAGAWQSAEEQRQSGLMNMMNLGRGSMTAGMGGTQAAGNLAGSTAERLGGLRAEKMRQISGSAGSGMQCLCRNFMAADELTNEVVRFRDALFEKGSAIDRGYKLFSVINVPFVKFSNIAKFIMKYVCLKPLGAYADFYFGKNRWGFLISPIGFFWIGLWVILGAFVKDEWLEFVQEAFEKEVAQWALQRSV